MRFSDPQLPETAQSRLRHGLAKHLRSTYFSTPSTLGHGAFPFWSGELFNKGRKHASEHVEIDISHSALAAGKLCDDGQWRQIVTIEDALRGV